MLWLILGVESLLVPLQTVASFQLCPKEFLRADSTVAAEQPVLFWAEFVLELRI